jgi:hypothetical protein
VKSFYETVFLIVKSKVLAYFATQGEVKTNLVKIQYNNYDNFFLQGGTPSHSPDCGKP